MSCERRAARPEPPPAEPVRAIIECRAVNRRSSNKAQSVDPASEALTLLTLYGYKKASTHLEEALVDGIEVEALSKENRGRPSLNSMAS
jgi:hypothetical protein